MTHAERAITITAKIYEARNALKQLTGPDVYAESVERWQAHIRREMQAHGCGEIEGAMHCIRELSKSEHSLMATSWVLAAVSEMIEPSEP